MAVQLKVLASFLSFVKLRLQTIDCVMLQKFFFFIYFLSLCLKAYFKWFLINFLPKPVLGA